MEDVGKPAALILERIVRGGLGAHYPSSFSSLRKRLSALAASV
jgi:hypothetical protein